MKTRQSIGVVALHGFLGLPEDWRQLPWPSSFDLRTVDLWPWALAGHDFQSIAETLLSSDWMREFAGRSEKPLLMGYSMGGRLAMHLAIESPHLWAGAIFISSHPGLESEQERLLRHQADCAWANRFADPAEAWSNLIDDWNKQPVLSPPPGAKTAGLSRDEKAFSRQALAQAMKLWSLGRQRDLRADLAKLPIPVLFLSGDRDTKFTSLMRGLTLSSLQEHVVIENAAHRLPWDQPDAFMEVVGRVAASWLLPGARHGV